MSLLDNGPDVLTVRPEVLGKDERDNPQWQPGKKTITVTGQLEPLSSQEDATQGQQADSLYRFVCREFPAGPWSAVTGADGREWDVVGEPARYTRSARVRHDTVTLRARTVRTS